MISVFRWIVSVILLVEVIGCSSILSKNKYQPACDFKYISTTFCGPVYADVGGRYLFMSRFEIIQTQKQSKLIYWNVPIQEFARSPFTDEPVPPPPEKLYKFASRVLSEKEVNKIYNILSSPKFLAFKIKESVSGMGVCAHSVCFITVNGDKKEFAFTSEYLEKETPESSVVRELFRCNRLILGQTEIIEGKNDALVNSLQETYSEYQSSNNPWKSVVAKALRQLGVEESIP